MRDTHSAIFFPNGKESSRMHEPVIYSDTQILNRKPVNIFYSYSHSDESFRVDLEKHLSLMRRNGEIAGWHDRNISAGTEWKGSIDKHLERANIILLLVSADFLASDYCYEIEMKRAMKLHTEGKARVIPIILRDCDWSSAPFAALQALPRDAKPINNWNDPDEAYHNVVTGIRQAVAENDCLLTWSSVRTSGKAALAALGLILVLGSAYLWVIQQLNKLSLDRDLSEIELSFKPSPEQSSRIAEALRKINNPAGVTYNGATMRAERIGDHWKIYFDPVSRPEGVFRFAPVSSDQAEGNGFEEVLRQASSALWIKWGAGTETEIEPKRNQFPSAIVVSENTITYVLRAPLITLNLNYLSADPTFTIRGEGDIKTLRFRSRDPRAIFDQRVDVIWKEDRGSDEDGYTYIKATKPFLSGPHRLQITFKTLFV